MSREVMSEEERRRRRNEASRRCYLKRKAFHAAQKKLSAKAEAAAKGGAKPPKAKPAEAKPAKARPPAPRGKDPVSAAEKIVRRFAKVAAGIKPMVKEAAEFLGAVYKAEDRRVVEKVERVLSKGLGVEVASPAGDDRAKSRVLVQAVSKAVKTPAFRLETEAQPETQPESAPETDAQPDAGAPAVPPPPPGGKEEGSEQPAEVPVDPALIEKVEAGEADKSDIAAPLPAGDEDDEEDDEDDDDPGDAPGDEDEDEEDEDDDSDEERARRAERRARDEADNEAEYQAGRWEMLGEMGAQGAFDD